MIPQISAPGAPELLLFLAVVILLFGARKLPELARGSGQALRIFKEETKKDPIDAGKEDAIRELDAKSAELEAERKKLLDEA